MIHSYKDLIVWQRAMDLVEEIYNITDKFPKEETYSLTSQMRRSAVSIPSNIAEGRRRGGAKEFRHFLNIAFGSGAELETQVEIVKRVTFGKKLDFQKADALLAEVMKMLNAMLSKMNVS